MSGRVQATTAERLQRKTITDLATGCVLFTGYVMPNGYAQIWDYEHGKKRLVHRVAYELFVGPIGEGLQVDHLCFVRHCVNPRHLEAVTALENTRRARDGWARRTHCIHGHAYTAENTRFVQRANDLISRACRRCDADRSAAARERLGVDEVARRCSAYRAANREALNARRRARYAQARAA